MQTMSIPKLKVPGTYVPGMKQVEVPLPIANDRSEQSIPRVFTDPLFNTRVRQYYEDRYSSTTGYELLGRVSGAAIGAAKGAYTGSLLGALIGLGSYALSALLPDMGTIAVGGTALASAVSGASIGKKIGAGVGAGVGLLTSDYTTGRAMTDLLKNTAGQIAKNPAYGILNSLNTIGRSMDVLSGGETIRATIYAGLKRKNVAKTIAEVYGLTSTGRVDYDTQHIREELGIDLGSVPNSLIDIIGDLATDPGFLSSILTSGVSKVTKHATKNINEAVKNVVDANDILAKVDAKPLSKAILEDDMDTIVKLYAEQAAKESADIPAEVMEYLERFVKEVKDKTKVKTSNNLYKLLKQVDSVDDAISKTMSTITLYPFTILRYGNRIRKLFKGVDADSTLGKLNYFLFGNKASYSYSNKIQEEYTEAYKKQVSKDLGEAIQNPEIKLYKDSNYSYKDFHQAIRNKDKAKLQEIRKSLTTEQNRLTEQLEQTIENVSKLDGQTLISKDSETVTKYLVDYSKIDNYIKYIDNPELFKLKDILDSLSKTISRVSHIRKAFGNNKIPEGKLQEAFDKQITELVSFIVDNPDKAETILEELYLPQYSNLLEYVSQNINSDAAQVINDLYEETKKSYSAKTEKIAEQYKKVKDIPDKQITKEAKVNALSLFAKKEQTIYSEYQNRLKLNEMFKLNKDAFSRQDLSKVYNVTEDSAKLSKVFEEAMTYAVNDIEHKYETSPELFKSIESISLAVTEANHQAATSKRVWKTFHSRYENYKNILPLGTEPTEFDNLLTLTEADVDIVIDNIDNRLKRLGHINGAKADNPEIKKLLKFKKEILEDIHDDGLYDSTFDILTEGDNALSYYLLDNVYSVQDLRNKINKFISDETTSVDVDVAQFHVHLQGALDMLNKHRTNDLNKRYSVSTYNKVLDDLETFIEDMLHKNSYTDSDIDLIDQRFDNLKSYLLMNDVMEHYNKVITEFDIHKTELLEQINSTKSKIDSINKQVYTVNKKFLDTKSYDYAHELSQLNEMLSEYQAKLNKLSKQSLEYNKLKTNYAIEFDKVLKNNTDISLKNLIFDYVKTMLYRDNVAGLARTKGTFVEGITDYFSKTKYEFDYIGYLYDTYRRVLPFLKYAKGTDSNLDTLLELIEYNANKLYDTVSYSNDSLPVKFMENVDTVIKAIELTEQINPSIKIVAKYGDIGFDGIEFKLPKGSLDDDIYEIVNELFNDYIEHIDYNPYTFNYEYMYQSLSKASDTDISDENIIKLLQEVGFEYTPNIVSKYEPYRAEKLFKPIIGFKNSPNVILKQRVNANWDNIQYRVVMDTETTAKGSEGLVLQLSVKVMNQNTGQLITRDTFYLDPDDYAMLTGANKTKYSIDQDAIDVNGLSVEELRKRKTQALSENARFITHQDLKLIFSEKGLYNGQKTALSYMFRDDSITLAHNAKFDFAALLNNFDMENIGQIYDANGNIVMEDINDVFDINLVDSVYLAKKFNIYGANKFDNKSIVEAFAKSYKSYYGNDLPYAEVMEKNNIMNKGLTLYIPDDELYYNGKLLHDADIDIDITDLWIHDVFKEIDRLSKEMNLSTRDIMLGNIDESIPNVKLIDDNFIEYTYEKIIRNNEYEKLNKQWNTIHSQLLNSSNKSTEVNLLAESAKIRSRIQSLPTKTIRKSIDNPLIKLLSDVCEWLNIEVHHYVDDYISKKDLELLYNTLSDDYYKDQLIANILGIDIYDIRAGDTKVSKLKSSLEDLLETIEHKRYQINKEIDNYNAITKRYHNSGYFGMNHNYVRTAIIDSLHNNDNLHSLYYILSGDWRRFEKNSNHYILAKTFEYINDKVDVPQLKQAVDYLYQIQDSIQWERDLLNKINDYSHRELDLFYQLLEYGNELITNNDTENLYYKLYNHLTSVLKTDNGNSSLPLWVLDEIVNRVQSSDSPIFMLDAADNFSNKLYEIVTENIMYPLSDMYNRKGQASNYYITEAYKGIRIMLENIRESYNQTLSSVKKYNKKFKWDTIDLDDFVSSTGLTPSDLIKQNYIEAISYTFGTRADQNTKNLMYKIFGNLYKKSDDFKLTGRSTFAETAIGNVIDTMSKTLGLSSTDFLRRFTNDDITKYDNILDLYFEDVMNDNSSPIYRQVNLINAKITELANADYITNPEQLQTMLKRMFVLHYYDNKVLLDNYFPKIRDYSISDYLFHKAPQYKEAFTTGNRLFENVRQMFGQDSNRLKQFLENRKDLVLVYIDGKDMKLRKVKSTDLESLTNVLQTNTNNYISIMSNSDFVQMTSKLQPVELPSWLKTIHKYLVLPQKLFSLTFSLPFMVTNMTSAYLQNATNNGFHPIKAFNTLLDTSKAYHKWKEIYQLATTNKYIWEMYGDVNRIESNWISLVTDESKRIKFIEGLQLEDANMYAPLIQFLEEANEDSIANLIDITQMSNSVASYSEIIDVQRNKVIGEKKQQTYEQLKKSNKLEDQEEFWVINDEPNNNFDTLRDELTYLENVRKNRLEFKDGPIENLYRRINTIKKKLDNKFNEKFSLFQKYTGMQKFLDINSDIEIIFRMSMIKESMEVGKEFSQAAQDVIDRHFIYNDKSIAERMIELVIPFVSYPVKAANLFSELSQDNEFMKIMYTINKYSWGEEEKNIEKSKYLANRKVKGDIPIGDQLLSLGNSFTESLLTLADPVNTFNNKMNPIGKTIYDTATGSEYNRWNYLLGPFSSVPDTIKEIQSEGTFNPGTLLNMTNTYNKYNYSTYYRAYPQKAVFYNKLYTKGGYSRVQMNMSQTTLNNLRYRVGNILYNAKQRRR